ncbi:MAG: tRNA glutamyl-Q(34) synthetase GluQRS [Nitrosomonadales bacterium]|nr:tRNA glutamyl-Q(34) synthetase GluQRS [Nitrosomonadales bacterium]
MPSSPTYRGRFAPSPTGPLHFGSLVAAVGSYLDAKHHHGTWLVRMEDLDAPRCVAGAADDILLTLEAFGLHSDEPILYQSQRTAAYEEALRKLQASGTAYPCCCTRKEISDSALNGLEGPVYPGTCRAGIPAGREGRAWRVRTNPPSCPSRGKGRMGVDQWNNRASTPSPTLPLQGGGSVEFTDDLQGRITQHLESEIGDFVVKRADGQFAYQLAVVVDDAFQGITHIVRGADLLDSTPRQIYLQRLLGLRVPQYLHLPVAVNESGEKLSKQTLAAPVDESHPVKTLLRVLNFLRQQPPSGLTACDLRAVLEWAVPNWDATKMRGIKSLPAI